MLSHLCIFTPNTENRESEVERHIWLKAFQIDPQTDLDEEIGKMLSEFVTRVESTEAGASGLVFQYFTSSTLAYSLNFFEYGGCDPYFSLPNCICERKAITDIASVNNDCFVQCIKHHFKDMADVRSTLNFDRIHHPTNFRECVSLHF